MKDRKNIIPEDQVDLVRNFYNYSTPFYRNTTGDFIHGYPTHDSDYFMDYLAKILLSDGMHILDAGCGMGAVSIALAKRTKNTHFSGVTISDTQSNWANERIKENNLEQRIKIICGDYHKLNNYFKENHYDIVLFVESLFHARNPEQVVQQAYKVLKPGGKMYLREFFKIPYQSKEDIIKREVVIDEIIKNYFYYPPMLNEFICTLEKIGFKLISAEQPPYPSDFEKLIKLEKAIGFDTYKYIAEFQATEWYEIIAIK